MTKLDSKIPEGNISEKWTNHKFNMKLVNPSNKRKFEIIVVGTGLAGASAAASLGELGYNVLKLLLFTIVQEEHTVFLHKVELMLLKIIRMMVIQLIDYFMILLKAEISAPVKQMFIVLQK